MASIGNNCNKKRKNEEQGTSCVHTLVDYFLGTDDEVWVIHFLPNILILNIHNQFKIDFKTKTTFKNLERHT